MRIRQVVFIVRDLAAQSRRLAEAFALDPPFRDAGVAEFGIDNAVFAFGDQFLELISPVQPGTAAGRHLERRGEGGYMLIVQTDDFDADRARLAASGVRLVWEKALPDIRAMHLHPKDIGGAIVSIDQPVPAAAWRWGGPEWRVQPGERAAQRVVGVTLEAAEPRALAERWAQVLALPAPRLHGVASTLALEAGEIRVTAAEAGALGIVAFTLRVVDPDAVRTRARDLGWAIDGDAVVCLGARIELQGIEAGAAQR